MTLNQRFGYIFGAIYTLIGVVGFFLTGFGNFASGAGHDKLIFFGINPLHNLVHLLVGVLLLSAASAGPAASKSLNILVGATYLIVGILGLAIAHGGDNFLAINQADNGLHFGTAILALVIGLQGKTAIE